MSLGLIARHKVLISLYIVVTQQIDPKGHRRQLTKIT